MEDHKEEVADFIAPIGYYESNESPFLYYGKTYVESEPGDPLGMSFPILCNYPVHHNPAALVVLTISGDQ
jgi:hypothetical protein